MRTSMIMPRCRGLVKDRPKSHTSAAAHRHLTSSSRRALEWHCGNPQVGRYSRVFSRRFSTFPLIREAARVSTSGMPLEKILTDRDWTMSAYSSTPSGVLPREIGMLTQLQVINIAVSKLEGRIPDTLGDLHGKNTGTSLKCTTLIIAFRLVEHFL